MDKEQVIRNFIGFFIDRQFSELNQLAGTPSVDQIALSQWLDDLIKRFEESLDAYMEEQCKNLSSTEDTTS